MSESLKSLRVRHLFLMAAFFCLFGAADVRAESRLVEEEYQIKAGFIYNFMQFIRWPPHSFSSPSDALVLGVYGSNPFGEKLKCLEGRMVRGRPVRVVEVSDLSKVLHCHMIFVPKQKKRQMEVVLNQLRGTSVITVGEQSGFSAAGGTINLQIGERKHMGFEINMSSARHGNVRISSKLLKLAVIVEGDIPDGADCHIFLRMMYAGRNGRADEERVLRYRGDIRVGG